MLRAGRRIVASVFLLVVAAVAAAAFVRPPIYQAEARLMVRIGREYAYHPEVAGAQGPRAPTLAEIVNSEVEILSSRDLAAQVVQSIGVRQLDPGLLERAPDPTRAAELAILGFREAIEIRPVLESGVIRVAFEHESPAVAARAVNRLVERFVDKHLEVFGEVRADTLLEELAQRHGKLAAAEDALGAFKASNDVFDLGEQRRLLLGRRLVLDESMRACESELAEARLLPAADTETPDPVELPPHLAPGMLDALLRQRFELEGELRRLEPELSDPLVRDASLRLLDLELEEEELRRELSPNHRRLLAVRSGIEHVMRFLAVAEGKAGSYEAARRAGHQAKATAIEARIAAVQHDIELLVREDRHRRLLDAAMRRKVLEARRDELRRLRAADDGQIRALDGHEKELARLARERTAADAAYEACRTRVEEARLREELDRDKQISVRVIEQAVPPAVPSGLPRSVQVALGAVAGLIAGVGAALLAELCRAR